MKILTMTLLASGKVHAMGELRMVLVIGHENRDMSRKTYLGCFISSGRCMKVPCLGKLICNLQYNRRGDPAIQLFFLQKTIGLR